ncbi:class I SAM-dependent methyltransferase [Elusimicrobiota bacterium]
MAAEADRFECENRECVSQFPVVDGIPVLLNARKSLFEPQDYVKGKHNYYKRDRSGLLEFLLAITPTISANIKCKRNYRSLARLLTESSTRPKVLVLGGAVEGQGLGELSSAPSIDLLETDVSLGERTMAIVDSHCIPFKDNSFDCVVSQAVLEHVIDPYVTADEISRVVKEDGLVYAETAFMQQVHGGEFDFTRFSLRGHRRLFAQFEEIESGAVCGTGMALAWSYRAFLMSLTDSATLRRMARIFAGFTGFWLKYFDHLTIENQGTLEGASGFYFLGRKSVRRLQDRDLIQSHGR